jgi:CheY-like chemotaxis protein
LCIEGERRGRVRTGSGAQVQAWQSLRASPEGKGRDMIRVCFYEGCGVVYGEKKPFSDTRITHGLCPKHFEVTMNQLRAETENLTNKPGIFKVLIVEDNAPFRKWFKDALHARFPSADLYEAIEGEEALYKTDFVHPDLVFMDIRLPGENGCEVTKKIKAKYPGIIVVIFTGYDLPEYREFCSQYADHFLSKSSSTAESIFSLVESILPSANRPS